MAGGAVRPAVGREGMGAAVALILTRWRAWLAFAALGSAAASAYRGDWAWTAAAGVLAVLPPALWLRGAVADTRAMMLMLQRPGKSPL